MSIKLIGVDRIGKNKFLVTTASGDKIREDVVTRDEFGVKNMDEKLPVFNSESPDFSEVWGSSFEFRREVTQKISELVAEESFEFA